MNPTETKGRYAPGQRKPNTELTQLQIDYCHNRVRGMPRIKAYMKASPGVKRTSANVMGRRFDDNPLVAAEIERLRAIVEKGLVMEAQEKREFLAKVVRAKASEIDGNSVVVKEVIVRRGKGGTETINYKAYSKLEAIHLDNQMAGHNKPIDVNLNQQPGVMLVPVSDKTLDEVEQELMEAQRALKANPTGSRQLIDN